MNNHSCLYMLFMCYYSLSYFLLHKSPCCMWFLHSLILDSQVKSLRMMNCLYICNKKIPLQSSEQKFLVHVQGPQIPKCNVILKEFRWTFSSFLIQTVNYRTIDFQCRQTYSCSMNFRSSNLQKGIRNV